VDRLNRRGPALRGLLAGKDRAIATATFDPARLSSVVETVKTSLADHKAEDLVRIDLAGKTDFADAMVIASGQSARHVGALADHLVEALKDQGLRPAVEGMPQCDWVLIDAGDVVVHLFRPEVRAFYNLEKMWGAPRPASGALGAPGAYSGIAPPPTPPLMMAAAR
jgi:ribosome-associated protein